MKMHHQKPSDLRSGQSTVEFMLMIPVLFSVLFFVIQMGLYFTTIHYASYAAYSTARAQVGNFNDVYSDAEAVSRLMLTGQVWGADTAESINGGIGASVTMTNFESRVPFPFISALVPPMNFDVAVNLGPREVDYEGLEGRPSDQYDNNSTTR